MSELVQVIEGAMRADAEAVRVIGQNIANAEVTAYRRQIPLGSATFANALEESSRLDEQGRAVEVSAAAVDFQQGTLRGSSEPLHVALDGAGFFVVNAADGMRLTRRGDFKVSAEGILVTSNDATVLGENGPIQVGSAPPRIETDGTVFVNELRLDRLRVVDVAQLAQLQYRGDSTFTAPPELDFTQSFASVRQGHLEASNVTPVNEMVQLMETVRHFESAQRFIRGYDDMMQKAISELGKVG
jgi:flagellar basal-body rod protein FlgF